MPAKLLTLAILVLVFLLTGCAAGAPAAQPTATLPAPTAAPPTETLTPTVDAPATQAALQTSQAVAAQETVAAATATKAAERKISLGATQTAYYDHVRTSTAEVKATEAAEKAAAEAQEAAYRAIVQELFDSEQIGGTDGEYRKLDDQTFEEARINTPFIEFIGLDPVNFMISAEMTWSSASDNANWPTSGCGFVYGYKDRYTADLTYLGLDGYTHSFQFRPDRPLGQFAFQKWGEPERPDGQARIRLVIFDKHVYVYVNDELANDFYNGLYSGGEIGFNVFSGTNKGYGTRCTFENVELFLFD